MRYWTSDLHLGHKNIIEYCRRPFRKACETTGADIPDVEAMNAFILDSTFSRLKKGDTLVVVGDAALNPKWAYILGKKLADMGVALILVAGNHDACFPFTGRSSAATKRQQYYANGWKEIHLHWKTQLSNGLNVLVSHLPYASEAGLQYDVRYQEYRPKDLGMTLIHGHLHGKYKKFGRMVDVGYDAHEGQILSEDELIALINDPRDFIGTHLGDHYANRPEKKNMKGMPNDTNQVSEAGDRQSSL